MVARVWTQTYGSAPDRLGNRLPASGLRLVAASASPGNSLLVLAGTSPDRLDRGPFMRSPRRPPLQTLLAADLLTPPSASPGSSMATARADATLLATLRARLDRGTTVYVVSRRPLAPSAGPGEPVVLLIEDALAWQGLLEQLVRRCTAGSLSSLRDAQHRAMTWARSDAARFEWTDPDLTGPPRQPTDRTAPPPRATTQVLADEVFAALLQRIDAGRLGAGDRITESSLARAVHTSRSHVRDALRALATSGLVDLEPNRGALVPAPRVADVVEIYAARRALGAILVRRATRWAPGDLDALDRALADLLAAGGTGDAHATGDADLRFQDALAHVTGMRRIPPLFTALTAQLRLHIAVMGLDYTYAIPDMCRDDTELLHHVRARDEAAALGTWHRKIDDALDYMTGQLAHRSALSGRRPAH